MARRRSSFYARVPAEEQQTALEQARELEGLDEEITLLRTLVQSAAKTDQQDIPQLLKLTDQLVKAVAARARITGKKEDELPEAVAGVLNEIREVLGLTEQEEAPWSEKSWNEEPQDGAGAAETAP